MTNVRDAIIRSITEASIRCKSAWTVIDENKWDSKRTELNNGSDNPALQELRKLLEAAKAALEAAKKAKKNAGALLDIPNDSTKINYDGGAANNAREGIKNAADVAKGNKGKASGKDLHTYSGQGVHEFDNAQYTDDGIIIGSITNSMG